MEIGKPRVVEIDGSVSNILPLEARLRDLTYSAPLYLDMVMEEKGVAIDSQRQHIGDLPVMVKSKLCALNKLTEDQLIEIGEDSHDPGGYFIVHGS